MGRESNRLLKKHKVYLCIVAIKLSVLAGLERYRFPHGRMEQVTWRAGRIINLTYITNILGFIILCPCQRRHCCSERGKCL